MNMVVSIPSDIARMREADKIVRRWCAIQNLPDPVERVRQFTELRKGLFEFAQTYGY
ncbi:hypothetical protein QKW35_10165 [Pontibacterium granulatum]|uniref:hypothetical protein n=1 Tax=Pontibacterium granulatum TaxID=2036029 RepID=UPI00249CB242|nr:hypothetical protein [Pontibacterium granulatum]MDI3324740.1 hypothetical protein [Pontibacterium granulatum]